MHLVLARALWGIHILVMLFIVLGWAMPWSNVLWAVVILHPIVLLNWRIFDDRCVLTIAEEKLRGAAAVPAGNAPPIEPADEEPPTNFVSETLSSLLGRPVPRGFADVLSYGFVCGGFVIAAVRLYLGAHA